MKSIGTILGFLVAILVGISWHVGKSGIQKSELEIKREELRKSNAELVVLNNSATGNCCQMLKHNKHLVYRAGSKPISWYLMFKNIVLASGHRPKYLMIPFWDYTLFDNSRDPYHTSSLGLDSETETTLTNDNFDFRSHVYLSNHVGAYRHRNLFFQVYLDSFNNLLNSSGEIANKFLGRILFEAFNMAKKSTENKSIQEFLGGLGTSPQEVSHKVYWLLRKKEILPVGYAIKNSIGNGNIQKTVVSRKLKDEGLLNADSKTNDLRKTYVHKIVELAQKEKIRVIFLRLKTLSKARDESTSGISKETLQHIKEYTRENDIAFISLYDEREISTSDFRDELHLHSHGATEAAAIIDQKLSKIIKSSMRSF